MELDVDCYGTYLDTDVPDAVMVNVAVVLERTSAAFCIAVCAFETRVTVSIAVELMFNQNRMLTVNIIVVNNKMKRRFTISTQYFLAKKYYEGCPRGRN